MSVMLLRIGNDCGILFRRGQESKINFNFIFSRKSGDWLPSKMVQTAVTRVFKTALEKTDNEKDDIFLLMVG